MRYKVMIVLLLVLSAVGTAWFLVRRGYERYARVPCASNLRLIGQAVMRYAENHDGTMPASVADILTQDIITPDYFKCVASETQAVYLYPATRFSKLRPDQLVAHEALDSHRGEGCNVLFGDLHVEWLTLSELRIKLAATRPSSRPVQ